MSNWSSGFSQGHEEVLGNTVPLYCPGLAVLGLVGKVEYVHEFCKFQEPTVSWGIGVDSLKALC